MSLRVSTETCSRFADVGRVATITGTDGASKRSLVKGLMWSYNQSLALDKNESPKRMDLL